MGHAQVVQDLLHFLRQGCQRLGAGLGQAIRLLGHVRPQAFLLPFQLAQVPAQATDPRQPLPQVLPQGDQCGLILAAVFLQQAVQAVEPFVQAVHGRRVQVHFQSGTRSFMADVLQLDAHTAQPFQQGGAALVVARCLGQRLLQGGKPGQQPAIPLHPIVHGLQRAQELFRVLGAGEVLLQDADLAFLQGGSVQFVQLKGQVVRFLPCVGLLLPQGVQPFTDGPPLTVGAGIVFHRLMLAAETIHEAELERTVVQQQRVVLAVHVQDAGAQFAQLLQAHRGVVDEGPGPAVGLQLAPQDAGALPGQFGPLEPALPPVGVELDLELDDATGGRIAHDAAFGPFAGGQTQRAQ